MAENSTVGIERSQSDHSRRLDGVAWGLVALGLAGALLNILPMGPTWVQLTALLAHGFVLATGAAMLARHRGTVFAIALWFVIVLICFPAFPRTLPERRELAHQVHLVAGVAGVALAVWASGILDTGSRLRRWSLGVLLLGLMSAPAVASVLRDWRAQSWQPPQYDDAAWRFLTATSVGQTDSPHFPSALRRPADLAEGCTASGCHPDDCRIGRRHAFSASSLAYQKGLADFADRKGQAAARWCDGCHMSLNERRIPLPPLAEKQGNVAITGSIDSKPKTSFSCGSCHLATDLHGGYGSAAVTLAGPVVDLSAFQAEWRPRQHKATMLRPLHRSSEFCGACHRKNWSLPQNGYRFVAGQDEFRQWRESRYAEGALLAPGEAATPKSCLSCHGNDALAKQKPALELDAFLRGAGTSTSPPQIVEDFASTSGKRYYLDVVVHNAGIGHDFPTGMADQRESWLEVTLRDRRGRPVLDSGSGGERHLYRLVGVDREGKQILHGDMDRMVRTAEWRRIPAGGSDLARYELTAPPGIESFGLRLVRSVRPEFARWSGQLVGKVEVLAHKEIRLRHPSQRLGERKSAVAEAVRWRRYAEALAGVKAYPFAVQAMQRALSIQARDVESLIGLARIFLAEGDVLSAQDQLRLARDAAVGDAFQSARIAAWMAVATRTAQPAQAIETLTPLVKGYPQDLRLRFELGRALMDQLRNREAAVHFKAMLDADPLDAAAHYQLMLCYQRLNLLSEARREEVVYRLMTPVTESSVPSPAVEATPLHVHRLEAPR